MLLRTPAGFRAYDGLCPHQGALLGEGELDGDALVCRNHRWRFEAESGRRRGGPQCLVACRVETRGGEVWIDPSPLVRARSERTRELRAVADLPGPRGLPLLGNTLQIDRRRIHATLEGWAEEHGPLYRFRLGPQQVVGIADPDAIEQVLRARPGGFRRSRNIGEVLREAGVDGVFSAEGDVWRPQRRLAMHALAHKHLVGFYPTLALVAERLRRRWQAHAEAGTAFEVSEEMKRFTVDVTSLLVFGHDMNTLEQEGEVIQRKLEVVFPTISKRLFAPLPTWRWLRSPADRRFDRVLGELGVWLAERVAETRAQLERDPQLAERPRNFLQSMLAARDDAGEPFPDSVVYANAMTMLLAGEDTTAHTLAWAVHHLCDSPDAVAALRAEADEVLGGRPAPADIETAESLAVAGATANEAMRLRPVAPLLLLEANEDTVVGDVAVPKGTWVGTLQRPPVLDEAHFDAPREFRPARWLNGAGGAHEPGAHMPFGSGPRICPGRSLALLEMKLVLALLYASFDVERVGSPAAVEERFSFTMMPEGLAVRLRPRG